MAALLTCPWCGPRPSTEFAYLGVPTARPDPVATTPQEWRDYLYLRPNTAGWALERWYHRMGCRRYVVVERHTVTNECRPAP